MYDDIGETPGEFNAYCEQFISSVDQVTQIIQSPNFNAVKYMKFHSSLVLSRLLRDDDSEQALRANATRTHSANLMMDMMGPRLRMLGRFIIDKLGVTLYNSCHATNWVINHIIMLSRGTVLDSDIFMGEVGESAGSFGEAAGSLVVEEEAAGSLVMEEEEDAGSLVMEEAAAP
jgi:hypothetical protein